MSAISCKNIKKSYDNTQVVHGFDIDIKDEEFIVFLGPSGCGKSTIMRMIAGLEEITSGELLIASEDKTYAAPGERGVSLVFQNYALYPHMNVYKNIEFGLKRLNLSKIEIERRINDVVDMLQLKPYLKRKPAQMSGGQQQRVAIARAIVKTPNVFLFDEPLSNLDAKLRYQLRVEIAKLHRKLKTTTIFVTHDQLEAMTLADRIVLMNAGNVEQIGTPKEIYSKPQTKFVADFIGAPAMNIMRASININQSKAEIHSPIGIFKIDSSNTHINSSCEVDFGFRPQDLLILEEDNESSISGVVNFIEYLGNETMLTVECNGHEFNLLVPNSKNLSEGEKILIGLNINNVHLFSIDTGKRLNKDY